MKKIIFIVLAFCCAFSIAALKGLDISADAGLGYMNYTMVTTYKDDVLKTQLKESLAASIDFGSLVMDAPKSKDSYNALLVGLGVRVSYFYANISVGFPFKNVPQKNDPLGIVLARMNATDDIKGSIIADGQFGGGITLFKNKPFNIFAGGAIALNYISTKRVLPEAFVSTIAGAQSLTEYRAISMLGVGVNLAARYYFTPKIGVSVGIKETLYFLPFLNNRYYKGTAINGQSFTYYVKKNASGKNEASMKDMIKSSWANDFELRVGVAFKF